VTLWLILAVLIVIFAAAGWVLGRRSKAPSYGGKDYYPDDRMGPYGQGGGM
jgi:hypothetical protein